jgi:hypothetical protein
MKSLVLILCVLIAVALLALGLMGKRPRPSDGSWVPLNASGRAGLIVLAMTVALAAIAYQAGWIFPPRGATKVWTSDAAPPIGGSASPTLPKALWNEAAVAQQTADARRAAGLVDEPAPAAPTTEAAASEPGSLTQAAVGEATAAPAAAGTADSNQSLAQVKAQLQAQVQPSNAAALAAAAEPEPPPCDCANPPAKPAAAAKAAPAASSAAPRRSTRSTTSRSVASSRDGRVSVCDVQRRYGTDKLSYYGLTEADLRAADAQTGSRSASRSYGAASAGSVLVRNRLGPEQRAEVLRISIDGGASSELRLGPGKPSGSVRLRIPAGSARYRLSGYTEFADGRRVPIDGEGWIDEGDGSLQVRTADASYGGALYLEPG